MKKMLSIVMSLFLIGCTEQIDNSNTDKKKPKLSEIGSFYTEILDKDQNRVENLKLCAMVLDGFEIISGEEFSFNDTVGRRTKEKGYEEASILIGDEKGYAVGGGVCQISSTLFNAAQLAGMEITERHNHSKEVKYISQGRDAAVSWGTLDLKFRNISKNTVRIGVSVENGFVCAKIYELKSM